MKTKNRLYLSYSLLKTTGLKLFSLLVVTLMLSSCHDDYYYRGNLIIENNEWSKDKIIQFKVGIKNNLPYDLIFNVANTEYYEYANLWLFISVFFLFK